MIRDEIRQFAELGPLPGEAVDLNEAFKVFKHALDSIKPPIGDDEARLLVKCFGPDESFGLGWTLLHLIETAPHWPIVDCLRESENEWVARLRERAKRGDRFYLDGRN